MHPSLCRYPGFAGRLGLPRATLDSTCNAGSSRTVGSNVEFGSSGGMLQVERVELLANALQNHPSLESLFVASALILCDASLLLLGLLRTNNSLLPEGRLEAFELRAGHLNFGGCGSLAVDFEDQKLGIFSLKILIVIGSVMECGAIGLASVTAPPLRASFRDKFWDAGHCPKWFSL